MKRGLFGERDPEIECLRQAVRRLAEKCRLMIQLRDPRELKVAKTARHLSITVAIITRHLVPEAAGPFS